MVVQNPSRQPAASEPNVKGCQRLMNVVLAQWLGEQIHYRGIANRFKSSTVAIITPYSQQVQELKKMKEGVERRLDIDLSSIKIETVDQFQGHEADIVIFDTVLSKGRVTKAIGFLADRRRACVALTDCELDVCFSYLGIPPGIAKSVGVEWTAT